MRKALISAALIVAAFTLGRCTAYAQTVTTPQVVAIACAQNTVLPIIASGQHGLVNCDANGRPYTSGIGWTPIGAYATPIAVTNASAASLLPSGSSVTIYNTGANVAYVKFGLANTVTATTSDDAIPSGGGCGFYVYPNTWIAALTASSTTTLNISGGSGMAPGCWGGSSTGGGGGTNVTIVSPLGTNSIAASVAVTPATSSTWAVTESGTWTVQPGNTANTTAWKVDGSAVTQPVSGTTTANQGTAAGSGPWITTPWIAGAVNSATNGLYSNVLQGNAVLSATNGLFNNLLQANAVLTGANPLFTALSIAGAVDSATNGIYSNLLQGNAVISATNGLYANVLQGNAALTLTNPLPTETFIAPVTNAQGGNITPVVSAALEASNTFKSGAGNLYAAYATSTTGAAGYFVCINATSISSGAITPLDFVAIPAGPSTAAISYGDGPAAAYSTGITCAVTIASTPFTYTSGGSVFAYHGMVK